MSIHKYTPGEDDERGRWEFMHDVKWPIVSRFACFDPSMISVMQFRCCLYYFKVINNADDDSDINFELWSFSMKDKQEYFVKSFSF